MSRPQLALPRLNTARTSLVAVAMARVDSWASCSWFSGFVVVIALSASCSDHRADPNAASKPLPSPDRDTGGSGTTSDGAQPSAADPAPQWGGDSSPTPAAGAAGSEPTGAGTDAGGASVGGANETSGGSGGVETGGAGGADDSSSASGESCTACARQQCGSALDQCQGNPECAPWLACLNACTGPACADACDASHDGVARVYRGVYACLCQSKCEDDCSFVRACDKQQCTEPGALAPTSSPPASLAKTGLYDAAHVYGFEPAHALWADGAGKDRYIYVPACSTIDTKDMDHWQFPVGTRLWKHFAVGTQLVETRFMLRYGTGNDDWLMATYGWDATKPNDPAAALLVPHGQPNAQGTLHDIPDPSACPSCHGKLAEKPLGFSAIELSHAGSGLTMQKLSDWGWLSVPARAGFEVPGTPAQRAALGYLHANCGGCHNSLGQIPRENPMLLRLSVSEKSYAETNAVRTTVGVPTINSYPELHGKPRIDPEGAPANSAIYLRMSDRDKFPMPPLATKFPDTEGGVATVRAWIESLSK